MSVLIHGIDDCIDHDEYMKDLEEAEKIIEDANFGIRRYKDDELSLVAGGSLLKETTLNKLDKLKAKYPNKTFI